MMSPREPQYPWREEKKKCQEGTDRCEVSGGSGVLRFGGDWGKGITVSGLPSLPSLDRLTAQPEAWPQLPCRLVWSASPAGCCVFLLSMCCAGVCSVCSCRPHRLQQHCRAEKALPKPVRRLHGCEPCGSRPGRCFDARSLLIRKAVSAKCLISVITTGNVGSLSAFVAISPFLQRETRLSAGIMNEKHLKMFWDLLY